MPRRERCRVRHRYLAEGRHPRRLAVGPPATRGELKAHVDHGGVNGQRHQPRAGGAPAISAARRGHRHGRPGHNRRPSAVLDSRRIGRSSTGRGRSRRRPVDRPVDLPELGRAVITLVRAAAGLRGSHAASRPASRSSAGGIRGRLFCCRPAPPHPALSVQASSALSEAARHCRPWIQGHGPRPPPMGSQALPPPLERRDPARRQTPIRRVGTPSRQRYVQPVLGRPEVAAGPRADRRAVEPQALGRGSRLPRSGARAPGPWPRPRSWTTAALAVLS